MTHLIVKDLSATEELSSEELEKIRGGMAAEHEQIKADSNPIASVLTGA
jgi:hypothetical protein